MSSKDQALATLRRIAFLLERSLAESYRVQAFRNAAKALDELPTAEFDRLAQANQLKKVAGVGAKTEAIVKEVLSGTTPEYLTKLESEESPIWPPETTEAARELRAAITGDCHTHSTWSDGGSPIIEMAQTARDLGHQYMVLTDHSPRLTVANGLSAERLLAQFDEIDEVNKTFANFKVLKGIEVDILDDGALDQADELLQQLDLVVASVHSKLRMDSKQMTERMINAVRNPLTNVLGHCTGRKVIGKGRPQSEFDAEAVFSACIESNTAVEINCRPERTDPPDDLLKLAFEMGCNFSIDTDSHAPGQLDFMILGCIRAAAIGITPDRIINTNPHPRLQRSN